ncbi:MAG TPA: zeta toxin family protein [Niastella sp.]
MNNPVLFIVAGPNGSGKSLFSKELTIPDLEVFDGDKHMEALLKKYPETGSEALWSFINENIFEGQKRETIKSHQNYAFETNYSSAEPMKTAREFKNAGYEIHLLFMGLNSLEESMQRVAYRVSKGGHKVSEESIRYNYEFGFKNLYKYVSEFDSVTLFDNGIVLVEEPVIPQKILHVENGKVYLKIKHYPAWVEPVLTKYQDIIFE